MSAEVIPLDPVKPVKATTFREVGQNYNRYTVTVPVGWTLEDVVKPEAWSQIAGLLDADRQTGRPAQTGSIVEVRTEDHAFYAELYIRAVRKMALDMDVLSHKLLGPQNLKDDKNFETKWNVGAQGYDIIRASDKVVVGSAKDFKTKEAALSWIEKMKA